MGWAKDRGEAGDYTDNVASQRFSPLGHWYEVSNMMRNGVLGRLLTEHPQVKTMMLHNIDTLGADLDPTALGYHLKNKKGLTFEVVPRHIDDRGGGLARVNGQLRLLEGHRPTQRAGRIEIELLQHHDCLDRHGQFAPNIWPDPQRTNSQRQAKE